MKNMRKCLVMPLALVFSLAGCVADGMQQGINTHLSATQCRDLTALRSGAPITHESRVSELAVLRAAGYVPPWDADPNYPEDLQAAQRQVDGWYEAECQKARSE